MPATELSAGFGVHGRSRKAASFSERARLNVTRAARSAIERIAQHSRPLAIHLKNSIETGKSCSYRPDPPPIPRGLSKTYSG